MCKAHTISRTGDRSSPFRPSASEVSTSQTDPRRPAYPTPTPISGTPFVVSSRASAPPPYEGKYVHAKQRDTFGAIFPGMASRLPARTRAELLQNSQHRHEQRHYNEANAQA